MFQVKWDLLAKAFAFATTSPCFRNKNIWTRLCSGFTGSLARSLKTLQIVGSCTFVQDAKDMVFVGNFFFLRLCLYRTDDVGRLCYVCSYLCPGVAWRCPGRDFSCWDIEWSLKSLFTVFVCVRYTTRLPETCQRMVRSGTNKERDTKRERWKP